jgi:hypothetical protein
MLLSWHGNMERNRSVLRLPCLAMSHHVSPCLAMSRLEEGLGNATAARCDRCDSAHEHQEWQHGHGGESKERHWWHRQAFHDVFIMLALKCHDCLTFRTQTASGQSQCKSLNGLRSFRKFVSVVTNWLSSPVDLPGPEEAHHLSAHTKASPKRAFCHDCHVAVWDVNLADVARLHSLPLHSIQVFLMSAGLWK